MLLQSGSRRPRRPHPHVRDNAESESPFYSTNLPLAISLELANHPIPRLCATCPSPTSKLCETNLEAQGLTCLVTVLVRYDGGAFIVILPKAAHQGRGWKSKHVEWIAYMSDCPEVETVCVERRELGPAGVSPDPSPLITLKVIIRVDYLLDNLAQIFNTMRGRAIAFCLTGDYGVESADVRAESLAPYVGLKLRVDCVAQSDPFRLFAVCS